MQSLDLLIRELEDKIPAQEHKNGIVSKASVGWHIEHTLLTMNVILEALKTSDPQAYQWKFNFIRTLIMTVEKIPRGRAQSPKVVQPANDFNATTLQHHAGVIKEKIKVLDELQANHHFKHPYFGYLNLKPAIKFLQIHTHHHLSIINDILKHPTTINHQL